MIINLKDQNLVDCININESYNKDAFLYKDNLVLPYVNIQVIDDGILDLEKYSQLDYSYLILEKIKFLKWKNLGESKELVFSNEINEDVYHEYFTIGNMTNNFNEILEVKFEKLYIYFSDKVKIKQGPFIEENIWIPQDNLGFKLNMDKGLVKSFFEKKSIPIEILDFFKLETYNRFKNLLFDSETLS